MSAATLRDQLQTSLGTAYTLEQELGGGGMSRVFVAREHRLDRQVVVKLLAPELGQGLDAERFEREIRLAASLQQANIVPVLSAGEMDGLPYFTMPFVAGRSLRQRLEAGPLPMLEVLSILRDVARALAYAHTQGVVHRDIKPDNVLLSGETAVVTDFGIAKAISASRTRSPGGALTQVGTVIGTPAYMAPEQAAGDPATDHRADVYAFGCMAYELLTGRPPFHELSPHKLLAAHIGERPVPVESMRPDTPPALAAAVGRWALATAAVGIVARASLIAFGLPDWVLPGALAVMALGLPVVLFTWFAQRVARRATPPVGTMGTFALRAAPHVSWRRTSRTGFVAVGAFVVVVAVFMGLRAYGIGPAGSLFASGRLEARSKLLVAEFNAPKSDSTLGRVVAEAVRASIGQARVVRTVSSSEATEALVRMRRAPGSRIDLVTAREMAQREGYRAIVTGDVAALGGGGYFVTVKLVDAEKGDELAAAREGANGPNDLIPAIDRATRALRGRMGESLRAVRASLPLAGVTTPSLDALRAFTTGLAATERGDTASVGAFERAIALDSSFSLAYLLAGISLRNQGRQLSRVDTLLARVFALRDRLPPFERLLVTGTYYQGGRGYDRAKALAAAESSLAMDSTQFATWNLLMLLRQTRGEFAAQEHAARQQIRYGGVGPIYHLGLVNALLPQAKWREADSVIAAMRREGRDMLGTRSGERPYLRVAALAAMAGELAEARRWLARYDADITDATLRRQQGPLRAWAEMFVAMHERRWDDALRLADTATRDADGGPISSSTFAPFARGLVHDAAGRADEAIADFEAYLTTFDYCRSLRDRDYLPYALEKLGSLYEQRGDAAKALASYGRFVELWKDAEPELQPRVADVRRRIERLRRRTG